MSDNQGYHPDRGTLVTGSGIPTSPRKAPERLMFVCIDERPLPAILQDVTWSSRLIHK